MTCPTDIVEILLEILAAGLLSIRVRGWNGQADRCALEADHLHNLPSILAEYHLERLLYYWDAERDLDLERTASGVSFRLESAWQRLEPHVEAIRRNLAHS